ncbi:MAG: diphthine synthase [Desulfurococcales archaeon]|nr:diphthine synthase [Desulfurococcales archaeon]
MLYLVGLGLWIRQITIEAIDALKESNVIYLDSYTNLSSDINPETLSKILGKPVTPVSRDTLEFPGVRKVIHEAETDNVSIATVGDPLVATTHSIILEEASSRSVPYKVIHGVSGVYTSILESLLQAYKFGRIITLVYPLNGVYTYSTLLYLYTNMCLGLHTLLLLDLKLDESKLMKAHEAASILMEMEVKKWGSSLLGDMLAIVMEASGTPRQKITIDLLREIASKDFHIIPQSIVIPGKMHFEEEELLRKIYECNERVLGIHRETLKSRLSTICKRAGVFRGDDV